MASQGRYHRNIFKESKRYQSALMQKSDIGKPSYIIDADFRDWADIILRQQQRSMSDIWTRLDGDGAAQDNLPAVQHSWALLPATADANRRPGLVTTNNFIVSGQKNRLLAEDRNSPENCASGYVGGLRATLFGDVDYKCTLLDGTLNTELADGIHRKYTSIIAGQLHDDRAAWSPGFFQRQNPPCTVRMAHGTYTITGNTETTLFLDDFVPGRDSNGDAFTDPPPSGDRFYYINLKSNPADAAEDLLVGVYLDVHLEDVGRQEDPELNHNPGGSAVEGMRRNKLIQQVWLNYSGTNNGVPENCQPITDYSDAGGVRHHVRFLGNIRIRPGQNAPAAEAGENVNNINNGMVANGDDIDDGRDFGGVSGGSPNLYEHSCFSQVGVNGRAPSIVGDLDARTLTADGSQNLDSLITEWTQQPSTLSERLLRDNTVATVGAVRTATATGQMPGKYYGAQGIQAALDCDSIKTVYVKSGTYELNSIRWTTDNQAGISLGDVKGYLTVPAFKNIVFEQGAVLESAPSFNGASVVLDGSNIISGKGRIERKNTAAVPNPNDGPVVEVNGGLILSEVIIQNLVPNGDGAALSIHKIPDQDVKITNCNIFSNGVAVFLDSGFLTKNSVSISGCRVESVSESKAAFESTAAGTLLVDASIVIGKRRLFKLMEESVAVPAELIRLGTSRYTISNNTMFVAEGTGAESCLDVRVGDICITGNSISFYGQLALAAVDSSNGILPLNTIYVRPVDGGAFRGTVSDNIIDSGVNGISYSNFSATRSYIDICNNDVRQFRRDSYPTVSDQPLKGSLITYRTGNVGVSIGKTLIQGNSCQILGSSSVVGRSSEVVGIGGIGPARISNNVVSAGYGTPEDIKAVGLVSGIVAGVVNISMEPVYIEGNLVTGCGLNGIFAGAKAHHLESGFEAVRGDSQAVVISENSAYGCLRGIATAVPNSYISGNSIRNCEAYGIATFGSSLHDEGFKGQILGNNIRDIATGSNIRHFLPGAKAALGGIVSNGGTIRGNHVQNVGATGILSRALSGESYQDILINDNTIKDTVEGIIISGDVQGIQVDGNSITGTRSHGIGIGEYGNCEDVKVSNNEILGVPGGAIYGQAIYLAQCARVSVSSNLVDWEYDPSGVSGADNTKGITKPILSELDGHGMAFMGCQSIQLTSNKFNIRSQSYDSTTQSACITIGKFDTKTSSDVQVMDNVLTAQSENPVIWIASNEMVVSGNVISNQTGETQLGADRRALMCSRATTSLQTWSIVGNTINGSGLRAYAGDAGVSDVTISGNVLSERGIWAYGNGISILDNRIKMQVEPKSGAGGAGDAGLAIRSSAIFIGSTDAAMVSSAGASRKSHLSNVRDQCSNTEISNNVIIGASKIGQRMLQASGGQYTTVDAPYGRGACIAALVGKNSSISNNTIKDHDTSFTGAIGILLGNVNYRSKSTPSGSATPFGRVGVTQGVSVEGNKIFNGMKIVAAVKAYSRLSIANNVLTLGSYADGTMIDANNQSSQALVQIYHENFESRVSAVGSSEVAVVNFVGNSLNAVSDRNWWAGGSDSMEHMAYIMTSCGRNYPEPKDWHLLNDSEFTRYQDLLYANIAITPTFLTQSIHQSWATQGHENYHHLGEGMHEAGSGSKFNAPVWIMGGTAGVTSGHHDRRDLRYLDSLEVSNPGFRYYGPAATGNPLYLGKNQENLHSWPGGHSTLHYHPFETEFYTIDNGIYQPGNGNITYKLDHYEGFGDTPGTFGPGPDEIDDAHRYPGGV